MIYLDVSVVISKEKKIQLSYKSLESMNHFIKTSLTTWDRGLSVLTTEHIIEDVSKKSIHNFVSSLLLSKQTISDHFMQPKPAGIHKLL